MFNVGTAELLVILLVALLVLGPTKLPDAARQFGRAVGELRRLSSGFQAEMRDALREPVDGTPTTAASATTDSDGALSAPRSSGADVVPAPPAPGSDGAPAAATEDAAPAGASGEHDGDGDVDGGTESASAGQGGGAASPPARDPGANGSSPT